MQDYYSNRTTEAETPVQDLEVKAYTSFKGGTTGSNVCISE